MAIDETKLKDVHGINYYEYIYIHSWLKTHYGKAYKCENKNCHGISTRFEYALVEGKLYRRNRENFIMLCKSCHIRKDNTKKTYKKIKEALTGSKQTLEHRINKSISSSKVKYKEIGQYDLNGNLIRVWPCPSEIIKNLKISNSFTRCLKGKVKSSNGFIWKYHLQTK